MRPNAKSSYPYLLARVKSHLLGISSEFVREIVPLNSWVRIPKAPPFVRGVINLRGQIIRLLDLRVRFGLASCPDETEQMVQMLDAREQDHVRWLAELELSARQRRPFTLALDPTKCAFGKWYYSYQVDADTLAGTILRSILLKFDLPHRKIHAIGSEVGSLAAKGEFEEAFALIEKTRSKELSRMVELFQEARGAYRNTIKEIAIVLDDGSQRLAVSADLVLSAEQIAPESIHAVPLSSVGVTADLTPRCALHAGVEELVLLLDTRRLFADVAGLPELGELADRSRITDAIDPAGITGE
jgi:chemotaxis signal transduction protein